MAKRTHNAKGERVRAESFPVGSRITVVNKHAKHKALKKKQGGNKGVLTDPNSVHNRKVIRWGDTKSN